jgi:FkbM family methyltransferase
MQTFGELEPRGFDIVWLWVLRSHVFRGRLKREVFRAIIRGLPVVDVEVDGFKMRCHISDNTTEYRIVRKGTHHDVSDITMITSRLTPGDVFIDIGANCGLYTLHAARLVGPHGIVVAIEPSTVMRDRLAFNVTANEFNNVKILTAAVGEHDGDATLYVNESERGQSSLISGAGLKPLQVPMMTLHTIVRRLDLKRIDALKIDIEGYEDHAIHPFLLSAPKNMFPRLMLVEVWEPDETDNPCINHLLEAGYRVMGRTEFNVLMERGV